MESTALPKYYIPIAFAWGILVGEMVPGVGRVVPLILLTVVFWILFQRFRWELVVLAAPTVGLVLEMTVISPGEVGLVQLLEDPVRGLMFYVVVWPVMLVVPFLITRLVTRVG